MTDLRERCARAILQVAARIEAETRRAQQDRTWFSEQYADAVLAIARPAIIEECALVAESCAVSMDEHEIGFYDCAERIRKLAEKP